MSGGQKYLNINGNIVTSVGTTRITSIPGSNNRASQMQAQRGSPGSAQKFYVSQPGSKPVVVRGMSFPLSGHTPQKVSVQKTMQHRAAPSPGPSAGSVGKRRKMEKGNKGLRHFSMKVCEKVKEKGTTTYNEVADELVEEEMRRTAGGESGGVLFDQKNIRRRVYDALNVLMAMNIIDKEKKMIHWLGLPTNTPAQVDNLDSEIEAKKLVIAAKEKQLKDLLLLQVSLKNLVNRNRQAEEAGYIPTPNSHIQLPFIVVNTHRDTHIHCTISQDKTEYFFKFDDKFELNDHVTVLQRMGLLQGLDTGTSTEEDIENLKKLVPAEFQKLIEDYGRGVSSGDYVPDGIEEEDSDQVDYVEVHPVDEMDEENSEDEETIIEDAY